MSLMAALLFKFVYLKFIRSLICFCQKPIRFWLLGNRSSLHVDYKIILTQHCKSTKLK